MNRSVGSLIGLLLLVGVGIGPIDYKSSGLTPVSGESHKERERSHISVAYASERVAPMQKLIIPTIKVNAPIVAMGLDEGRMAVPDNYTEIGWYKYGTVPGNKGSAVMGAHVDDGKKITGVFKNLKRLNSGDDVYVVDTEGNALHFRVIARKIYPYKTQITNEVFQKKDAVRLNLITCHGAFIPEENTYTQRLVIFTELVQKERQN